MYIIAAVVHEVEVMFIVPLNEYSVHYVGLLGLLCFVTISVRYVYNKVDDLTKPFLVGFSRAILSN